MTCAFHLSLSIYENHWVIFPGVVKFLSLFGLGIIELTLMGAEKSSMFYVFMTIKTQFKEGVPIKMYE